VITSALPDTIPNLKEGPMIDIDVDDAGIATLTMDMADRPMNVLNDDSAAALGRAIRSVIGDAAVKGVVITSRKRDFMAGADLTVLLGETDHRVHFRRCRELQGLWREIETGGKPFVAAINGTALGGGYELALACHHRVAIDNTSIQIGLPEVTIGLLPGSGGTQRLPRMIGIAAALPLLLDGTRLAPADAMAHGLVDAVVPADDLIDAAKAWLRDGGEATKPWDRKGFRLPGAAVQSAEGYQVMVPGIARLHEKTNGNYPAPLAIMSAVYEGTQVAIDTGLKIEARYFARLASGCVAHNLIRTMFFSMGDARRLKRRPKDEENRKFSRVGVLGAGMMGKGIATTLARAGIETVVLDTSTEVADQARQHARTAFAREVERRRMTDEAAAEAVARLRATDDVADLAGCDMVIEAVFEDQAIKAGVTRAVTGVLGDNRIFASNTSTLPISELAEASTRPAQFVGMHFFSPVERMTLVEVIRGRQTSDAAVAGAMDLARRLGKVPVLVNDSRWFFTSRVINAYLNEAYVLVEEGVAPALIENVARHAGLPIGPLALTDEVTFTLQHRIRNEARVAGGRDWKKRPGDGVVSKFVETLDRPGRSSGRGFYDYPADGPKRLWPGLADVYPLAAVQPAAEDVRRRLLYIQGIESVRCLEEGVILAPEDADVASVLGWGFPSYLGGTISMIQATGVARFSGECDALAKSVGERFAPPDWLRNRASSRAAIYGA
jgi:3-hydroxyacyl-CoA dehydrogenase/enoyl-CoA hydratase/3-hydroxybutyryl-CoA epimerase